LTACRAIRVTKREAGSDNRASPAGDPGRAIP